jgi:hypothetical protein
MKLSLENKGDIQKYYLGTFVKFQETGDRIWKLFKISNSDVLCVDCDGFEVAIDLEVGYNLEYAIPSRCLFQLGETAALLYRRPARQYYRGIHPENTGVAILHGGKWVETELTHALIQQYVDKPCYQSVMSLSSTQVSYALSKHFALGNTGELFCLTQPIGSIKNKVVSVNKLFVEELKPLIPVDYTWSFA